MLIRPLFVGVGAGSTEQKLVAGIVAATSTAARTTAWSEFGDRHVVAGNSRRASNLPASKPASANSSQGYRLDH